MAQMTGSLHVRVSGVLLIAALLTPVSAVRAQVGEPASDRREVSGQAAAEDAPAAADPDTGFPTGYWIEFDDTKDWLRLTSREWLRGDLNWMRDGDFEFDGDKTDLIRKGWSNVDQLHSPQINTYVFKNWVDVMGRAMITKDEVISVRQPSYSTKARLVLLTGR